MVAPYPTASRHPAKSPALSGASLTMNPASAGFIVSGRCSFKSVGGRFAGRFCNQAGWLKNDHLSRRHAFVFAVDYGEVPTHLKNKGLRHET